MPCTVEKEMNGIAFRLHSRAHALHAAGIVTFLDFNQQDGRMGADHTIRTGQRLFLMSLHINLDEIDFLVGKPVNAPH